MSEEALYRVTFHQRGEVYEIFARGVGQGTIFGFVEVEQLVFGERSKLLIDSSEERLKTEFDGVTRTYIPMHSIVRIDQVERAGRGRISSSDGKVTTFPSMIAPPGAPSRSSE